mmetsp:Transcript_36483/g.59998  ORF Transcript_36483/g.59998 Transcript_36483/m.59998 type:complete len:620 (-) Transcript_36483:56-1915(-)
MFTLFNLFVSVYTLIATIGFWTARWIIQQYDKAPSYSYVDSTQQYVYSYDDDGDNAGTGTGNSSSSSGNGDEHDQKLQTKLQEYKGPNPFTIRKLSRYERCKIYVCCVTGIALIRFSMFIALLFCGYLISLPINLNVVHKGSLLHAFIVRCIRRCIGGVLFLFAFYFVDETDSRSKPAAAATAAAPDDDSKPIRVIVCNHCTIFDGVVLLWRTNGVIAAKQELSKVPIVGSIMNALQTVWIDRSGKQGKEYAKQQIIAAINDFDAPPLIIFPQGTCSNIHTITSFRTGAYLPKQKILEISLDWTRNTNCDLSFVADLHTLAHFIHVACCQFINYCHLDIYNEHAPSKAERENINLFAHNSRKMVLRSLNRYNVNPSLPIVATNHSYSDFCLLRKAYSSNANFNTTNILMDDIISTLQLRTTTITYLAEIFSSFDVNKSGFIEFDEFCSAFDQDANNPSKNMQHFFRMLTTSEHSDRIGFTEFLVAVATCFVDDKLEDAVKIMFNANHSETDERYMVKEMVLHTYDKHCVPDVHHGHSMEKFVADIFGDREQLSFDEFYRNVIEQKYGFMVQHYLQTIITMRLKIKLTNEDFVLHGNRVHVNPLTELMRSTSVQSVRHEP